MRDGSSTNCRGDATAGRRAGNGRGVKSTRTIRRPRGAAREPSSGLPARVQWCRPQTWMPAARHTRDNGRDRVEQAGPTRHGAGSHRERRSAASTGLHLRDHAQRQRCWPLGPRPRTRDITTRAGGSGSRSTSNRFQPSDKRCTGQAGAVRGEIRRLHRSRTPAAYNGGTCSQRWPTWCGD